MFIREISIARNEEFDNFTSTLDRRKSRAFGGKKRWRNIEPLSSCSIAIGRSTKMFVGVMGGSRADNFLGDSEKERSSIVLYRETRASGYNEDGSSSILTAWAHGKGRNDIEGRDDKRKNREGVEEDEEEKEGANGE